MRKIIDGNEACSKAAYYFSEIACIYPITPSSKMASNIDFLKSKNTYNVFNDIVNISELESEAGAAGAMHGALLTGSLASTFTASQGLLLMIPNMYKMAGECLPGVIHVASRTIATHALSIFGDHSDIYATRQTGFCMLASANPTSAYHMAIIAHLSAIKGSLPFLHFFDGFRTSHELNIVDTIEENELKKLIDEKKLKEYKQRCLNVGKKVQYGMSETEDIYFQSVEARTPLYSEMEEIVNDYMKKINNLANTSYAPFTYYGSKDAKNIIIAMGSVCDTIKLVVDEEEKKGQKIGMVTVHLYRPFSKKYLENILPSTIKRIAVLDRTKEFGSTGEPLYLDVLEALKEKKIIIVGGRYGLSGKDTSPSQIYSVYNMLSKEPKNNFTIGITDDLNNSSLEEEQYDIELNTLELLIYGFGSDGMVSASKDLLNILGRHSYVQGYFEYDSKKSGGVTISHLRIGPSIIHAPYYIKKADFIVVTKDEYFEKYNILEKAKKNSILLINTPNKDICIEKFKKEDLINIKSKNIQVYIIDAEKIARENNIPGKINKIIEANILNILNIEEGNSFLEASIKEKFSTKGEDIVKNNLKALHEATMNIQKITIDENIQKEPRSKNQTIFEKMEHREGNEISVKEIIPHRNGSFEGGLSKLEKRNISHIVPKWIKENCIECGMCSIVCPHAVIRPFIKENNEYIISVSEKDCTGCGLCVETCPGKNKEKALYMDSYEEEKAKEAKKYFEKINSNPFNKFTIKGSQLEKPGFEFSGACAGCGETAYIKLITQLYKNELIIANATGCSSIYGGSAPITPYSIPWANSLFEDNAEFALGMHLSFETKRNRIKNIIKQNYDNSNKKLQELYKECLENFNNYEITSKIKEQLQKYDLPQDLKENLDYIPSRTVLAIGGDGWAYDIGFSGLDHILSSNENIKVLVLDTEVYSNTGGQMSKSSRIGAVAEFADLGKTTEKKDLFKIAMCYPNCFVASISLGANMMHAIKSIKEAIEHKGPSLIIAYSPCVEQGIKGGMSCSIKEQKDAVACGYTLLMKYHPEDQKLIIDYDKPDFDKYIDFLKNEVRYHALEIKDKNLSHELLEKNKQNAIKRYQYYKNITKS